MSGDPREALVACGAKTCRFNMATSVEPTCMLRMVIIDETGRCRMAEARSIMQPKPQAQTNQGRFEKGVWVE